MQDRRLFPDDFAEMLKKRAGQKYRPANGTEGDIFMSNFCEQCKHGDDQGEECCPIQLNSMIHDIDHPQYPTEWQYDTDGQPKCTAFEEVREV